MSVPRETFNIMCILMLSSKFGRFGFDFFVDSAEYAINRVLSGKWSVDLLIKHTWSYTIRNFNYETI